MTRLETLLYALQSAALPLTYILAAALPLTYTLAVAIGAWLAAV